MRIWKKTKHALRRVFPARPESPARLAVDAADFWNDSRSDERLRDLSHWAGAGRFQEPGVWESTGERHYRMFQQLKALAATGRPMNRMVEWGQGGGANAVRFARDFREFQAADISRPNLDECERQLHARGFDGFGKVLFEAGAPESVLDQIAPGVDFFLSTAVFQHFPGKNYGVRVTEVAHKLLGEGGLALIQTRYDDGAERFRPKSRSYRQNAVTFTSYAVPEYWKIAGEVGFRPLAVVLDPAVNYGYYFLEKSSK